MNTRLSPLPGLLAATMTCAILCLQAQVPGLIHYQGHIVVNATNFEGTAQFKFALVPGDGASTYWSNDGSSASGSEPVGAVSLPVVQGLYAVLLGDTNLANLTPIPPTVFTNADVRLRVWFNDGATGFQRLSPDQRIAAVGYAMMAGTVPDQSITSDKLAPGAVTAAAIAPASIDASKLAANSVTSDTIANGTIAPADMNLLSFSNVLWSVNGNPGTRAGTHFLGTTDNQPLEFRVNNQPALRLVCDIGAPSVIGGSSVNQVDPGVTGATIGGGGQAPPDYSVAMPNRISASFSTIGGGSSNSVQSGAGYATIGGGIRNVIQMAAWGSTIGGGNDNLIKSAFSAAIGGGQQNEATGWCATVPGGAHNLAGQSSFAAGYRAKAVDSGTFVWADRAEEDFKSTGPNQFLVRASGGVGIGTTSPQSALDVKGTVTATSFQGAGALPWREAVGTTEVALPNTGYLATDAAEVKITLPVSPAVGDVVRVAGAGEGGWRITQNSGQYISAMNITGLGGTWVNRGMFRNVAWNTIGASADGAILVAAADGQRLYVSTDYGINWSPRGSVANWTAVASSADGQKWVAVDSGSGSGGRIYISGDAGGTWAPAGPTGHWTAVAASADGAKLVATDQGSASENGGRIYTSTDSGVSWTGRGPTLPWVAVASSADGVKLVAASPGVSGHIYTSTDSGANWQARGPGADWIAAASSADGTKLVAATRNSQIYTSSDAGVSWIARENNRTWTGVACSADGTKMFAIARDADNSQLIVSSDSGRHWYSQELDLTFAALAASADGTRLVAVSPSGSIYTATARTRPGPTGYLSGESGAAIELLYVGNGQFLPISFVGAIEAR